MLDLVGVAEVAAMMGVSRQRVHEVIRSDADFPEPVADLAAGRIWQRRDVEAWMKARQRAEKGLHMEDVSGVVVASPSSFADMQAVGDAMRRQTPIAVELRRLDVVQMRRCIDFVSGAGYVAGAQVERLADRVYLVRPEGLSVTKRQRDALNQHFS